MIEAGIAPAAEAAVGRWIGRVARALALFGGAVLAALALMTCVSIVGRALSGFGLGPVPGDFELVQAGCGVAVFSFLPLCQVRRGHVTVDIVTDRLRPRLRAVFVLLGDVALAAAGWLIASRLWLGMIEKRAYGEETFILGMPVWWSYAASMLGAAMFAAVALHSVWRDVNGVIRGEAPLGGAHF